MTSILLWVGAILLVLFGSYVMILNWAVFWIMFVRRRSAPSWGPLLGGAALSLGFVLIPGNPYRWL